MKEKSILEKYKTSYEATQKKLEAKKAEVAARSKELNELKNKLLEIQGKMITLVLDDNPLTFFDILEIACTNKHTSKPDVVNSESSVGSSEDNITVDIDS